MMTASTVWTLALTLPFSPITSLPPTVISPPTSHSTWIESAMSNLPSMRARSSTTVSRGAAPRLRVGSRALDLDRVRDVELALQAGAVADDREQRDGARLAVRLERLRVAEHRALLTP